MSLTRRWTVDLAEVGADGCPLVGAKAWRLARLLQAGFPVSPGFCLSTGACRDWGAAVQAELLAAYRRLGGGPVAVRSSAVEEDGARASYAGVYRSELPVDGELALVDAVGRCLASWHGQAARDYRAGVGDSCEFSLAILVQRLVPAIAAGVAYTCDPLHPGRREVHINAVWGLAEPLAAGHVSADSFVLSRRGALLRQEIAEKPSQLTSAGFTAVAARLARAPSLTPSAARQVSELALRAEAFFGAPQDVEFALAADGPWLVQSRPIVAARAPLIAPLERYLDKERSRLARKFDALRRRAVLRGREVILSNGNVGELLPTPTLMSFALFQTLFSGPGGAIVAGRRRLGYRFDARATACLYELVAGQVYFNLEVDAATFDFGAAPPLDYYLDRVVANPGLANYPEVNLYREHYTPEQASACFGTDGAADALQTANAFHQGMIAEATIFARRYADAGGLGEIAEGLGRPASVPASAASVTERMRWLRTGLCVEFVVAARLGFYFAARVRQQLLGYFGSTGDSLCGPLLSGLPGSLVTAQAIDLERVLAGQLERDDFLAAYGHTADNELELSVPRLHESSAKLDNLLRDLAASGRGPAAEFERQRRLRLKAEADLNERLAAAAIGAGERAALLQDLHFAQRMLPLRETIKHHYTAGYAGIRRDLLDLAAGFGWEPALIFHLRPQELAAASRDPGRWRAIAGVRRDERNLAREAAKRRLLPNVIFGSRLAAIGQPPMAPAGDGWRGTGLSPGRTWGVARVIDGAQLPAAGEFAADDILVLRSANLGLAPLFRMVAGVVVEVGGLLAHSACQAREAGIPALLLPGATCLIPDGCRLLLDGTAGTISILSRENSADQHDFNEELDLAAI